MGGRGGGGGGEVQLRFLLMITPKHVVDLTTLMTISGTAEQLWDGGEVTLMIRYLGGGA